MSSVLDRPAAPAAPASGPAAGPPPRRPAAVGLAAPLRFAAFCALVVFGCLHWVRQVAPTDTRQALQMSGVAVGLAVALLLAGRIPDRGPRRVAVAGLGIGGALLALTAAGIPLRFAGWRNWGALSSGVGEGLSALPNLNVPYRGLDEWVRWTIAAGAALLGVLAAALAFAPGRRAGWHRRGLAALALCVLYGVAIVERNPEQPFLSGTVFATLLALFLGADRLAAIGGARPRALAAGAALGALGLAALVAPQLDADKPWVDYRGLAGDLAERNSTAFDWNHSYSPLDWPRDGREVLRIKAKEASYWKATTLPRFDGLRWVRETPRDTAAATEVDTAQPTGEPDWYEDLDVTVRGLRSEEYIAAGFTAAITKVPRPAVAAGSGTFLTRGRPLRPGDTYTATVYTPRPTVQQLRDAGTAYPAYTDRDLAMELPEEAGGPDLGDPEGYPDTTTIVFPAFGSTDDLETLVPGGTRFQGGGNLLAASGYARTWAAAQELRAAATSPFDLVRRVRRRVQQGARYTERPAQGRIPLDAFLFDTKEGYCQQFSGAMALLLRMTGIPARVASGFSPGTRDADRKQYIVRDLDAHSWVEAFFPGIGWVTFDPTPTVAPPAAQDSGDGGDTASDSEGDAATNRADVPKPTPAGQVDDTASSGSAGDGGSPVLPVLGGVLLLALLGAGVWRVLRPRAALTPLEELRRALARSGRPAAPELTLQGLERALSGTPAAQGYIRKLKLARYAGDDAAPSRQERAALREELGAGLGLRGRVRAWWALPPRLGR